jgi:hypothetical protein
MPPFDSLRDSSNLPRLKLVSKMFNAGTCSTFWMSQHDRTCQHVIEQVQGDKSGGTLRA